MKQQSLPIKLHIGCGPHYIKGWVNIDSTYHADVTSNVLGGIPFKDEKCDTIFLSHLLEHFTYQDAKEFLLECNRIAKKGAIIRIIVPDLEIFARKYLEKDRAFYNQPGPHNGFRFKGETLGDKFMYVACSGGHKYFYDFEALKNLLLQCGFGNIEKSSFGKSKIEGISQLDNRPEVSLFVEAQKIKAMRLSQKIPVVHELTTSLWRRYFKKVFKFLR